MRWDDCRYYTRPKTVKCPSSCQSASACSAFVGHYMVFGRVYQTPSLDYIPSPHGVDKEAISTLPDDLEEIKAFTPTPLGVCGSTKTSGAEVIAETISGRHQESPSVIGFGRFDVDWEAFIGQI